MRKTMPMAFPLLMKLQPVAKGFIGYVMFVDTNGKALYQTEQKDTGVTDVPKNNEKKPEE